MEISEPRLRSLLRQAERVASSGKRAAAENLYRQILVEAPENTAAWLGLAEVVSNVAEQEQAYQQVLALDPNNSEAQAALAILREQALPEADSSAITGTHDEADDEPYNQAKTWLDQVTAREHPSAAAATAAPQPAEAMRAERQERSAGDQVVEENFELVCYRHPNRYTALRCYSCGKPICSQCAVKTPVGYRCPVCIREAEDVFFTARPTDYLLAPLVTLPLSLIAGYFVLQLAGGFFFIFLMLFIGGAIGSFIGRIGKRVVGRRRGRYLPHVVAATVVLGVIIPVLLFFPLDVRVLFGMITPAVYLFVATGAAYYQMK